MTSKNRQTGVCLDYIYVIIAFHPRFLSHSYKKNVPFCVIEHSKEFPMKQKNRTAAKLQQPCIRFPILEKRLVVDQLIVLVVPAVKLTDLFADFLRRMLGSKLSHSLEVYLTTCRGHIQ